MCEESGSQVELMICFFRSKKMEKKADLLIRSQEKTTDVT